ncbi:MAG: hydroxymethylbilane synthase [Chthoniobacteraceae bacterium]
MQPASLLHTSRPLILGTRGSDLAIAQVELTRAALQAAWPDLPVEVKKIVTSGDRGAKPESDKAGLKGLFTKEIESALLAGEIDVAVHSAKDLPGQMDDRLRVGAVLPRAPLGDRLISKVSRSEIRRVGTSSVRRQRQLGWMFPGWEMVEWRGNVPTRLRKLLEVPEVDAIVLAEAGLHRLGIHPEEMGLQVETLEMLPAAGQGIVALQCRIDDPETTRLLGAINHAETGACLAVERALLSRLDGDCHLPVAARGKIEGAMLELEAILFSEGVSEPACGAARGALADVEAIASSVFTQLTGCAG